MNTCSCRNSKQMTLADARFQGRRVGDHVVPTIVGHQLGTLGPQERSHAVRVAGGPARH